MAKAVEAATGYIVRVHKISILTNWDGYGRCIVGPDVPEVGHAILRFLMLRTRS
jgi:hypothetical protein